MNIAGAILAGGRNTRMNGINKALIEIDGTTIIRRTINILKGIFDEILLITNKPWEFNEYKKEVLIINDIIKNKGPLCGIHSGLCHSSKKAVFFVACDMPLLHNGLIHKQLEYFKKVNCDALVPKTGNFIEPLHSVYRKDLAGKIISYLKKEQDYSIKGFLKTVDVCYWDLPRHTKKPASNLNIFRNINTPVDLKTL